MNNKGFAITGFIYTIFVIFIVMLIAILSLFNTRKATLDNLKKDVMSKMYNSTPIGDYIATGKAQEYIAKNTGYYNVTLNSPKVKTTNGSSLSFDIFLLKDETLKIIVGNDSYNNNEVELRKDNKLIAKASYNTNNNYILSTYNEFDIDNVSTTSYIKTAGSINISFDTNRIKKNESLNRVQYIKDCTNGNSLDSYNYWSEIKAFVNGENKALTANITSTTDAINNYPLKNINDNNLSTYTKLASDEQCIIVDLGRTYNLDLIKIYHREQINYGGKTLVSTDGKTYTLISINDELENSDGISISAYNDSLVSNVGNIYVPVRQMYGAKWLRLYYHNNVEGTVYWDSLSQVLTDSGYDSLHKQSVLYNIPRYINKNNEYEFLLTYSDLNGYNRWQQSSNPVTTQESVTGYTAVNVSWTENNWYGLASSKLGSVLLSGSKGNNYYGIGVVRSDTTGVKVNSSLTSLGITELWIRIDQLKE